MYSILDVLRPRFRILNFYMGNRIRLQLHHLEEMAKGGRCMTWMIFQL